MFGKWEWSAIIDIERDCKPAYRNTLFQVHTGGHFVNPPSWFGINSYNNFELMQRAEETLDNLFQKVLLNSLQKLMPQEKM